MGSFAIVLCSLFREIIIQKQNLTSPDSWAGDGVGGSGGRVDVNLLKC